MPEPAPGRERRRSAFARMRRSVVAIGDYSTIRHGSSGSRDVAARKMMRDVIRIAGSGFTVHADGRFAVILTACHVIADWLEDRRLSQPAEQITEGHYDSLHVLGEVRYVTSGGTVQLEFFRAPILACQVSKSLDVAAILIHDPSGRNGAKLHPATICNGLPEDGDEIVICGFPLGHELFIRENYPSLARPSFSSGIVSAALPYPNAPIGSRSFFRLNAIVHEGNSGSPVFDLLTGDVVGIVSTSFLEKGQEIKQPIGFAGATYALAAQGVVRDLLARAKEMAG